MYDVINHLDEEAVERLHRDAACAQRYVNAATPRALVNATGRVLIVADCARANFWNHLGLRAPLASTIEWHKHQNPRLSGASARATSLPRVLVIAPCPARGLPTQGAALADHLLQAGFPTTLVSRAQSGWGRLLDVVLRGSLLATRHDVVVVNVYAHRGFVYESVAILAAWCWRKRSIALLHNGEMPAFVQRWRRWSRWILSLPDVVLVPHGFLADALKALGLRIDGILPNCIDLTPFPFRARAVLAPRFLYLRSMHSYTTRRWPSRPWR